MTPAPMTRCASRKSDFFFYLISGAVISPFCRVAAVWLRNKLLCPQDIKPKQHNCFTSNIIRAAATFMVMLPVWLSSSWKGLRKFVFPGIRNQCSVWCVPPRGGGSGDTAEFCFLLSEIILLWTITQTEQTEMIDMLIFLAYCHG